MTRIALALVAFLLLSSVVSAQQFPRLGRRASGEAFTPLNETVRIGGEICYDSRYGTAVRSEPVLLVGRLAGGPPVEIGLVNYPASICWQVPNDPSLVGLEVEVSAHLISGGTVGSGSWTIRF